MKNLPNILTILRIILIPIIILLIVLDTNNTNFLALAGFIIASLSDYLDGPVSKLGKYKTAAQMMALFCLLLNPLVASPVLLKFKWIHLIDLYWFHHQ